MTKYLFTPCLLLCLFFKNSLIDQCLQIAFWFQYRFFLYSYLPTSLFSISRDFSELVYLHVIFFWQKKILFWVFSPVILFVKSSLKFLSNFSFTVVFCPKLNLISDLSLVLHHFNPSDSKGLCKSHLQMRRCTKIMSALNSSRGQFIFSCKSRKMRGFFG